MKILISNIIFAYIFCYNQDFGLNSAWHPEHGKKFKDTHFLHQDYSKIAVVMEIST